MRNEEFDTFLKDTEGAITRLAALYDQWFMGFERLEPHVARRDVEKRIDLLRKSTPNNTALRFRSQTLLQRWTTLREHWAKVGRQIEEGTYRRDVLRARKRAEAAAQKPKKNEVHEIGVEDALAALDGDALDDLLDGLAKPAPAKPAPAPVAAPAAPRLRADEAAAVVVAPPPPKAAPGAPRPPNAPAPPVARQDDAVVVAQKNPPPPPPARPPGPGAPQAAARPPAPPAPPRPPAPPQAASPAPRPPVPPANVPAPRPPSPPAQPEAGVAEPRMRAIYEQYVQKRRENNEPVDNVRYESLAASIKKMVPELEKKHQGKKIDFEVVVKDGKVGLKPVTR